MHDTRKNFPEPNAADRRRGGRYARQVQISLEQRHWAAAHAAIDAAEREFQEGNAAPGPADQIALGETSLDQRTVNVLEEARSILYVGDLAGVTIEELLTIPNVGGRTILRINAVLAECGLPPLEHADPTQVPAGKEAFQL